MEGRSAGRGVCFLRLPPPTSGLARRRQQRGARLDRELLRTPLSLADFGPGPEAAAEGRSAGRGVCFLRLSPPTLGLARIRRQDGEFAFYASRRRLRAWLGGGGCGARSWVQIFLSTPRAADFGPRPEGAVEGRAAFWPGVCFSIFRSLASRRKARLCSVTGPNTI